MTRRRELVETSMESILIKELRKENGLSLRELAAEADVSVTYLHQLEMGQVNPVGESFQKVLTTLCPYRSFAQAFLNGELQIEEAKDSTLRMISSLPFRKLISLIEEEGSTKLDKENKKTEGKVLLRRDLDC
ncbi:MAG TPA: helix-turn-helix transcriptional regulator [Bacteriovoracaceae bacterium]|nr:helix-turn-helix transcriptional regulator [Bacteriovoracaceae bacterium]